MNAVPPEGSLRDWLDRRAAATPHEVSHVFPDSGESLTWAGLREAARNLAADLAGLGLEPGAAVALMLANGKPAVVALFGLFYGGFRATPLNLVAGAEAIGYALSHSEARAVLLDAARRPLLDDALSLHPADPRALHFEGGRIEGATAGDAPPPPDPPPPESGDIALVIYTSGTTGRPKGVMHSHRSLLAGGWTTQLAHGLDPADRALCVLPLYHINGLCVTLLAPLVSGGSVVMPERFSLRQFWPLIEAHNVTWFSAVPTILSRLLHDAPGADPSNSAARHLRFARSASAPLAPELHRAFEDRFGTPIIETMGLTETAAQILSNPLPPGRRKIGSPGRPVGNEVMIADADLKELPRGAEGEILVRGPNVMVGYLKDPEATAGVLTPDGWLKTGDLGRRDSEGYLIVTGRLKELIIKGGENIAPREIDEALYGHPAVIEAAAFARACPTYGQRVEACVVLEEGSRTGESELLELCRGRLGAFKAPDRIHFMECLPKGPSGKIQRKNLAVLTH